MALGEAADELKRKRRKSPYAHGKRQRASPGSVIK